MSVEVALIDGLEYTVDDSLRFRKEHRTGHHAKFFPHGVSLAQENSSAEFFPWWRVLKVNSLFGEVDHGGEYEDRS